jgi:RNA polymerase subunit RPABC4/transcription elongation factor Spt4
MEAQHVINTDATEESIWRNNGVCEQCSAVVSEDELLPCHGENGLKDYACPKCGTAHYIVQ